MLPLRARPLPTSACARAILRRADELAAQNNGVLSKEELVDLIVVGWDPHAQRMDVDSYRALELVKDRFELKDDAAELFVSFCEAQATDGADEERRHEDALSEAHQLADYKDRWKDEQKRGDAAGDRKTDGRRRDGRKVEARTASHKQATEIQARTGKASAVYELLATLRAPPASSQTPLAADRRAAAV